MLSVKVRNLENGEQGWLNIPSSYQTIREFFLGIGEGEDAGYEIADIELEEPVLKKHLIGKSIRWENGPEELHFLKQRMEGFTGLERETFLAALEIEKPYTLMEIVNLSCNLDKFSLYPGACDEEKLGEYLLDNSEEAPEELAAVLDYELVGQNYAKEHMGCFSRLGYIFRNGKPLEAIYNGKRCPDPAYDGESVFQIQVRREKAAGGREKTLSVALPASEEKLEVAAKNLGVQDLGHCVPEEVTAREWELVDHLPLTLDVRGLNAYVRLLKEEGVLDSDEKRKKLCAALEAELPENMDEAIEIAANLDRYSILPGEIREPSSYACHVLADWIYQFDSRLGIYIDYEGYGKSRMQADGVVETNYGLVVRKDRPLRLLPEELTTVRLFSPLTGSLYPRAEWGNAMECSQEYSPEDLAAFDEQIAGMVREDTKEMQEKGGLAEYLDNRLLRRKVESMTPAVELWQDQLWGVLEIQAHGNLTESELKALTEEWSGQASDGWGEGFEQKPLQIQEGELYVSFWNSGDDFFIKTEEELKAAPRQGMSMQMGGM